MSLSLNCLVQGDDPERMFTVKIEKTENVSILRDLIKKAQAPRLDHLSATQLVLWKVDLPRAADVDASLIQNSQPLHPFLPLLQGFPRVEENRLHVVVLAPTNGELIWAESDGLIDVVQEKRRGEMESIF